MLSVDVGDTSTFGSAGNFFQVFDSIDILRDFTFFTWFRDVSCLVLLSHVSIVHEG